MLIGRIYSLDRIDQPPVPVHDLAMFLSRVSQASKRPADNELYDPGCDLVEGAVAIRRRADAARGLAVPALPGSIETALHELGCAAPSKDQTSGHAMPREAMAAGMHRGLMDPGPALADAELASAAARGIAGTVARRRVARPSRSRQARPTGRRLVRPMRTIRLAGGNEVAA